MTRAVSSGRWTAVLAVMGVLLLAPWPGRAAVPTAISYQGSLTDASGAPVSGTLNMIFSLYASPGAASALWSEDHSVTVTNGVFSVDLGSVVPFPPNLFTAPLYLGVTVGTDAEMTPRLPFRAVPFAFSAEQLVACAPGQTNCAGACVDLQSDEDNCGACGTVCAGGETCAGGTCTADPDADGDGWTVGQGDCDDTNPAINPAAAEVCNGLDDNCSTTTDEGVCICGNGITEPFAGEDCDQGGETATCDIDCTAVLCGDGVWNVSAGEQCDDGGQSATCDFDCTLAVCGDGVPNPLAGEQCDDGGESATCDIDCTPAVCGDGVLNATAREQCDDGNTVSGDGCSDACFLEGGSSCIGIPDGTLCDDGNACSTADQCQGEACVGGPPIVCDDDNVCTADSCDPATGCFFTFVAAGTPCGTGLVCDGAGTCGPP